LREALADADHDFVLREPASKLQRLRDALRTVRGRRLSRMARRGRRYLSVLASVFLGAAIIAVLLNALAWQKSRHPAPLFSHARPAVVPAKESRVVELSANPPVRPQPVASAIQPHEKSIEKPPLETPTAGPSRQAQVNTSPTTPHDRISELLKEPPALKAPPVPRTPPVKAERSPSTPSKPVMAAQRALVKLGFVLKPDGVAGATTQRAIERYERDHGLPVRGGLTPTLMRRLNMETSITR
jgi:Putative peptidoglycan binding domain